MKKNATSALPIILIFKTIKLKQIILNFLNFVVTLFVQFDEFDSLGKYQRKHYFDFLLVQKLHFLVLRNIVHQLETMENSEACSCDKRSLSSVFSYSVEC